MTYTYIRDIILTATAAIAMLCTACSTDDEPDIQPTLVVEGWIENGAFPVVIVTHSIVVSDEYQPLDNLEDCVERWATVKVSDGEHEVTLIGRHDSSMFPPYIYTTSDMRGEAGKTYRLTVTCNDGSRATAETTIPKPVSIDSVRQEKVAAADTLRQLYCYVTDDMTEMIYYKVFVHIIGHPYGFMSASMGITSSDMLPADGRIAVNQGRINMEKDYIPYFAVGDEVVVKLARLDRTGYLFWRDFEDMVALSRNPLFPATDNMRSNVDGALGYWLGYGSNKAIVNVGQ